MTSSWPIQIKNLQQILVPLTKNKDHRKETSQLDKSMNQQQCNYYTKINQKNLQWLNPPRKPQAFSTLLQKIANLKVNVSYRVHQDMIKARKEEARKVYSNHSLKHLIHLQDQSLHRISYWMVFVLELMYPFFYYYYYVFYYLWYIF